MASSISEKFRQEFEARSGDTIRHVVMARAYGSRAAIYAAGLEPITGKKDIWGLLIFAEKGLHFFVHPSETSMGFLLRSAMRADPPKEQWAVFPKERIRGIIAPPARKGFLASLIARPTVVEITFAGDAESPASSPPEPAAAPQGGIHTLYFEAIESVKDGLLAEAAAALLEGTGGSAKSLD